MNTVNVGESIAELPGITTANTGYRIDFESGGLERF